MKPLRLFTGFILLVSISSSRAQTVSQKLLSSFQQFESDPQLRHAISSLYVIDAGTGQVVFDKNSQIGLAGASTQKIITAATAFELLGSGYGYKTFLYLNGSLQHDTLMGDLVIKGAGDPTLGSWRYENGKRETVLELICRMLKKKDIKYITGSLVVDESLFESNSVPTGWIWEDIGNYYGAGAYGLNWNENQFDLFLDGGKAEHDPVTIVRTEPDMQMYTLVNELSSGSNGSGDNAYIYFPPYATTGFLRGTIPAGGKYFKISGSVPYPARLFQFELETALRNEGISVSGKSTASMNYKAVGQELKYSVQPFNFIISPSLDSIVYWFFKRSINLYGEALVKTMAAEKNGFGSTDSGVAIIKKFWKEKGIDDDELNIFDGSGLSPMNRITTHAQVEVLKYAQSRYWFPSYYNALPEYNGMKMKSGTIRDVKGFCGYQKAADGKTYIFSFLVNNYNGFTSLVVNKMFKVLDNLK